MRQRRFSIAPSVAILCAGVVMFTWPVFGGSLWAGETTQGTVLTAQEKETPTKPGSDASEESKEGQDRTLKKDAKKALRDLNEQIAALGKQVKKQGTKVGSDAKEGWNDLKEKQRAAKLKLKELSSSAGEARDKAKSDFKAALDDLRKSYDKAVSYFK